MISIFIMPVILEMFLIIIIILLVNLKMVAHCNIIIHEALSQYHDF